MVSLLTPFFDEPRREFGVREIARIWHVAPATASRRLEQFEKEGLLTHRAFRRTKLYKAADTINFQLAKRHTLLVRIHESLLPALNEAFWDPTVILFGSAVHGRDTNEIDLLVITEEPSDFDTSRYEQKLKRRIDLFIHRKLSDLGNKNLIYNVLNGLTIQGDAGWISESVTVRSSVSRRTRNGRRASKHSATRKRGK